MGENIVEFSHLIHSFEAFEDSRWFDDGVLLYQYLRRRRSIGILWAWISFKHKKECKLCWVLQK